MTTLNIFLPEDQLHRPSDTIEYLFGNIKLFNRNLSIYVTSVASTTTHRANSNWVVLGILEPIELSHKLSRAKYASISSIENKNILIERRHTSYCSQPIQHVQIVMYNSRVIASLNLNCDYALTADDNGNATMHLLHSLRTTNDSCTGASSAEAISDGIDTIGKTICPGFVRNSHLLANLFAESAVYGHFSLWLQCIKSYSFRK